MTSPSEDYLTEATEEDSQQQVVTHAPTPPTRQQLAVEDLILMQEMGLTLSDSESPRGIQIPVEPGLLLMGNGPLPLPEDDGDGSTVDTDNQEEEEEEEDTHMESAELE